MKMYVVPMKTRLVISPEKARGGPAAGHAFTYVTKDCIPVGFLDPSPDQAGFTDREKYGEPIEAQPGMVVVLAGWQADDHCPTLYAIDRDGEAIHLGKMIDFGREESLV